MSTRYEKTRRCRDGGANPTPARKDTDAKSWSTEAQECYNNGIMELNTFCHPQTGGLSVTLRKAAGYFKAAADRMDFVERLKKNTLQEFMRESEQQVREQ